MNFMDILLSLFLLFWKSSKYFLKIRKILSALFSHLVQQKVSTDFPASTLPPINFLEAGTAFSRTLLSSLLIFFLASISQSEKLANSMLSQVAFSLVFLFLGKLLETGSTLSWQSGVL